VFGNVERKKVSFGGFTGSGGLGRREMTQHRDGFPTKEIMNDRK
jgi:hypothetical protein